MNRQSGRHHLHAQPQPCQKSGLFLPCKGQKMGLLKGKCQGEYYVWHKNIWGTDLSDVAKGWPESKQLGDVVGLSHQGNQHQSIV